MGGRRGVSEEREPLKTQLSTAAAVLLCGAFAVGCNSKVKECNQVADIVNENVDALHKIERDLRAANDPGEEGKQAQAMVTAVQDATQKLEALNIGTDGLKPLVAAYVSMLKQVEEGGKEIVSQVEAAGELTDTKIDATLEALQNAQKAVVAACEKPSDDCPKVAAVFDAFPNSVTDDEVGPAFSKMGADLEKLELADGPVKTATTELIKVVKEKVVLLEKAVRLQKALEAAGKKIDDAVAQEDKVVDDLNGFCGAG